MVCNDLNDAAKDDDYDPDGADGNDADDGKDDYDDGKDDDADDHLYDDGNVADDADYDDGNDDASCDEGCWAGEGGRCLFLKGCPAPAHCEERQMKDWIFHFFYPLFSVFFKFSFFHLCETYICLFSISVKHISVFFPSQ